MQKPDNGSVSTNKPEIKSIHIEGRRWFRRSAGNTYCTAYIYVNGEMVKRLDRQGGYGDYYLQRAIDWLRNEKWIPDGNEYGTRYLREELKGTYSCVDVGREKDL